MEEEGRWITINGRHVFVKEGQHPMDAFIRQKGGIKDINSDIKKKTDENMKRHRYNEYIEYLSTEFLDKMKEYDRLEKPLTSNIDELYEDIKENGFKEPIMIEFNPNNGQITLGEGNHRLAVAKKYGIKEIPVFAIRSKYMEKGTYKIDPKNIIPREDGVLGTYYDEIMKPSKLGKLFGGEDYEKFKTKGVRYVK